MREILFLSAIVILFLLYNYYINNKNNIKFVSSYYNDKTSIGFIKPQHKLLHIFNNISSNSKIKLDGLCNKYIYNKNTIEKSYNDKIINLLNKTFKSISELTKNDYYIKNIENLYVSISPKTKNQRYIIDFFIYDIKYYYTIRIIADIVIIDNEIYINYINTQSGSNSTLLNKYDVKLNDSGILFDSDIFKENIIDLLDSYYKQSFNVIGISNSSIEYSDNDLSSVVSLNSLVNTYYPSSISLDTINDYSKKDLNGYIEMYNPNVNVDIKSPMFCNKYKLDWDKYGISNENDNNDKNCYLHNYSVNEKYNIPTNSPGLFNNNIIDTTKYDWMMENHSIHSSL
jgi:hypothetical protein